LRSIPERSERGNARMYDPAIGRFLSADTIVLKEASHFLARATRNR
jgi:hypothetical protein